MTRRFSMFLAVSLFLCTAGPALSENPTLDDVLAGYAKGRGGEALAAAKTMKLTGSFNFNGIDSPYTVYRQRPDLFRLEIETSRGTVINGFDGETAWSKSPGRSGEIHVREMEGEDRQRFLDENVDFDGPLVDSAKKGHKVELVGEVDADGTPAHHLRLTLASGNVQQWYLSKDDFLVVGKVTPAAHRRHGPYDRTWYLMDHQDYGGISLPSYIEREDRQHVRAYTLDKVEVGVEIDAALFAMPEAPSDGSE